MRWSDGVYLSTYHRVRAPTKDNDIPLVSYPAHPLHSKPGDWLLAACKAQPRILRTVCLDSVLWSSGSADGP